MKTFQSVDISIYDIRMVFSPFKSVYPFSLQNPFGDPSELYDHLELKEELVEKIEFFNDVKEFKLEDNGNN